MELKVVFLGTPSFAVPSLEILVQRGYKIEAVYTQPDRPKGRGNQLAMPPVKESALQFGLTVYQPERVRRPEVVEQIRGFQPEAMIVVGYGQIIPQAILDIPPLGIINVHASLLPKYRGAAPIQWAISNGETRTGVTTMRIDAGLDTGDILLTRETDIEAEETSPQLSERLARDGAELLIESLEGLKAGTLTPCPQDNAVATLAPILKKDDGRIDWNWPASKVHARMRGFDPWPGAYTTFRGQALHIRSCRVALSAPAVKPGTLFMSDKLLLAGCGSGTAIELIEVQQEGRKRVTADAFCNGARLNENESLGD